MYAKLEPFTNQLPQSAQLADGKWVSNYHLLPDAKLKAEGWLPADEVKPAVTEAQTLAFDKAVLVKGRIVISYKAVEIPPDPLTVAQAELDRYKVAVADIAKVNLTTALKVDLVAAVNKLTNAVKAEVAEDK